MRFTDFSLASLVAVPLVAAHGGIPGAPKVFGQPNEMAKLKNRNVFHAHEAREALPEQGPVLNARQGGQNGRCGASFGSASCAAGYCCSSAGWCGQGQEYCQAPDCQFQYGPACDANKTPAGGSTRGVARPQLGNVAYGGEGIYACRVPGTVAITYDDGPYIYTNGVLDQFKSYGAKATFFVTGINIGKGSIDDASTAWPAVLKRMEAEGHQIASHTWSHQDLSAITKEQRYDQMTKLEMAVQNVIGKFPTYMRPPYSSCTAASGCQQDLKDLGYVVSYFDLDTDDYNNVTPDKIQNAKNRVTTALQGKTPTNDDFLAIAHDIHQQTAQNLTGFMLSQFRAKGFKMVTMGECMGEPKANWYRSGRAGGNPPTATSTGGTTTPTGKVSVDGTCGGTNGYSCIGFSLGSCCSQYGWCGSTTDHCGTGCNSKFGTCGSSGGSPATTTRASTPPPAATGKTSTDGTCGGTNKFTCNGFSLGTCCSQYGWCGKSTDHCGTGCQSGFGTCGSSVSLSSSASDSVSPSSSLVSSSESVSTSTSASEVHTSASSSASEVHPSTSSVSEGHSTASPSISEGHPSASIFSSSSVATSESISHGSSAPVPSDDHKSSSTSSTPYPTVSSTPDYSATISTGASSTPCTTSTPAYSMITSVRASSTPCTTSTSTPTPTANVSKHGRCGASYDKQTCSGYGDKTCCRWDGKCGDNIFACGAGCQKKYGTCWW